MTADQPEALIVTITWPEGRLPAPVLVELTTLSGEAWERDRTWAGTPAGAGGSTNTKTYRFQRPDA